MREAISLHEEVLRERGEPLADDRVELVEGQESKLPVVFGAQFFKALGKIGFEVYRQRGSLIVMVRKAPAAQTTIPNHN